MLFPYNTDAPVYHWPFATVGLIVVNVLIFITIMSSPGSIPVDDLVLWHGQGVQPFQWISSTFIHKQFGHLLGNMLFLWVFGLVVEGKLGWQRFLAIYFAIGSLASALEQLIMLNSSIPTFSANGASAAIYGLMAMAAVWAPKNEVEFFYWFGIFGGVFNVPISLVCGGYVFFDLMVATFTTFLMYQVTPSAGFAIFGLWLHILGAAIGFPLAMLMLKRKVVDCEGWDILHVWQGDPGGKEEAARKEAEADRRRAKEHAAEQTSFVDRNRAQLLELLAAGHVDAALKLYGKLLTADPTLQFTRDELLAIIRGLHKQQKWSASAPFMAEVVDRFPEGSEPIRLKLAQICVVTLNRPGRALDLLETLDGGQLSPEQAQLSRQISRKAESLQAAGTVELDDGGW